MKTTILNIQKSTIIAIVFPVLTFASSCKQSITEGSPQEKVETIIQKVDIHTAVLKNDIAAVKQHISTKSDINQIEQYGGSTPLISAALFGRTEIAKLLIDAGANLNVKNNDGSTALITASFFCRPDIVKMLLEKKADKSIKNKYNQTARETILAPFSEAKPVYDMMASMLSPMGLKLDYAYMEKTRPIIVTMLK